MKTIYLWIQLQSIPLTIDGVCTDTRCLRRLVVFFLFILYADYRKPHAITFFGLMRFYNTHIFSNGTLFIVDNVVFFLLLRFHLFFFVVFLRRVLFSVCGFFFWIYFLFSRTEWRSLKWKRKIFWRKICVFFFLSLVEKYKQRKRERERQREI